MNGKRVLGWATAILIALAVINNPVDSAASVRTGIDMLNNAGSSAASFAKNLSQGD